MTARIEFVDTTTRDGNQSLWGATGLQTPDIVSIAPTIDRVGFHALDFTSSTHMSISVRYHREDPWARLRAVSAAMPRTPLTFLTTGMRFISWEPAEEDVIRLAFRLVMRNGIRRVQIADPMNDVAALEQVARIARQEGAQEIVVGLTYSVSDVHTPEHYREKAIALSRVADIDRLYLKDPGGLLTPQAIGELAPAFVAAFAPRPVELHSHCTIALAPLVYLEGARAGMHTLHTAVAPLANGTSQPAAETTARNVEAIGFTHDLDEDALSAMSEHFRALAVAGGLPLGAPAEYDATYYRHQLPGGVVTTMRRQLEEMRRPDLFGAAIAEVARVRADFGLPIVVTPYAQFLVTQATMNVMGAERYATVSDEVVRYFLGHFGRPPAPVDPDVADRVLALPRAAELAAVRPLSLEGARERFGNRVTEEELLLRLTMAPEHVDAMLAGPQPEPVRGPRRRDRAPVVSLLDELQRRPSITDFHLTKDDTSVHWRRAKADRAAG